MLLLIFLKTTKHPHRVSAAGCSAGSAVREFPLLGSSGCPSSPPPLAGAADRRKMAACRRGEGCRRAGCRVRRVGTGEGRSWGAGVRFAAGRRGNSNRVRRSRGMKGRAGASRLFWYCLSINLIYC